MGLRRGRIQTAREFLSAGQIGQPEFIGKNSPDGPRQNVVPVVYYGKDFYSIPLLVMMIIRTTYPDYVEERPLGRSVSGVFIFCFVPRDNWVVHLCRYLFFRSTMKASAYLGYPVDVVGQALRRTRNTSMDGMAIIANSVMFMTPLKLLSQGDIVSRHWVERLFPWLAVPESTVKPTLPDTDQAAAPGPLPIQDAPPAPITATATAPATKAKRKLPLREAAAYDAFVLRGLEELAHMSRSARLKGTSPWDAHFHPLAARNPADWFSSWFSSWLSSWPLINWF
jgi:hypothetical protein